ncbi:MAG: (deoxy)nucleoside triphosphate pyrophosphohydrolase, partial [Candidatus Sericytochromatia bacterium]|nr:(deoxy)nucleoside triphosphate pyrophosphohydrolase [Candidatus Sericytochromatia bacterium]
ASQPLDVVGAVIRDPAGALLCALRGAQMSLPGLWEFPGGKVGPGETPEEALVREIAEELACTIVVEGLLVDHLHAGAEGGLRLRTYTARLAAGTPEAREHAELRWLMPAALPALAWAPADLPTVACLVGDARHPSDGDLTSRAGSLSSP